MPSLPSGSKGLLVNICLHRQSQASHCLQLPASWLVPCSRQLHMAHPEAAKDLTVWQPWPLGSFPWAGSTYLLFLSRTAGLCPRLPRSHPSVHSSPRWRQNHLVVTFPQTPKHARCMLGGGTLLVHIFGRRKAPGQSPTHYFVGSGPVICAN